MINITKKEGGMEGGREGESVLTGMASLLPVSMHKYSSQAKTLQ